MKLSTLALGIMGLFISLSAQAQSIGPDGYPVYTAELAASMNAEAGRNVVRYNPVHAFGDNIGIEGMDPVSFYADAPAKGLEQFQARHQGVNYRFSTDGNRLVFLANPNKYEPTYGGWCARAMATGSPVPIDTSYYSFDFVDGEKVRINFFVSEGAMKSYHGLRRRDRRGSAEIAAAMAAGDQRMLDTAKDFQNDADDFWAQPAHGNEAPRFSNGVN